MSKTDKTAPHWVKWFNDPSYLQPEHRHEFHECNLPPKPTIAEAKSIKWGSWHDDCFWWPSFAYYRSKDASCGCYMCSKYAYESPPNKRRRREEKKYTRDAWRDEY